jgi:hypothetical protein
MVLNNALSMSVGLLHFVIAIVLIGILITGYFDKKRVVKRSLLGYIFFCMAIMGFFISELWGNFIFSSALINWVSLSFAILANIFFIVVSLMHYKNLNKKLFFSIAPLGIAIIIVEILSMLSPGISFFLYTVIIASVATILAYFLIIQLIIDTSEKTNQRRKK